MHNKQLKKPKVDRTHNSVDEYTIFVDKKNRELLFAFEPETRNSSII